MLLFSARLGETLAKLCYTAVATVCLLTLPITQLWLWILAFAVVFGILIFICDFLPFLLSSRWPEKAVRFVSPYASFFLFISLIYTPFFLNLAQIVLRKSAGTIEPLEEMRETIVHIIQSVNVKGKLNPGDKKLIESVITFKDLIVREAMVPRVKLFCLPSTTTLRQAAHLLAREGYSRVPVYRGGVDNIIGMLMYKDVLEIYMECEDGQKEWKFLDTTIETVAKGVFYTPETNKVSHLLQEFRAKQIHMAIVVDEYGGTAGVVTIEDILEEIVGDIADEYDVAEEILYTTQPGGGSWIVDGRMNIKDAEDLFGIEIPQEGDYETIAGYLFHKLGSSPEKGMVLHHDEFDLEVLSSTERSVDKVRITPRRAGV